MAESTVSGLLKALIATCEDAECGFRACASGLQRSILVDAALTGHSDMTLLAGCERIEEVAVRRYRDTLEQDLPRVVCAVVQRQVECIQRSRACMHHLRAGSEHAAA